MRKTKRVIGKDIPLVDFKTEYRLIQKEIDDAISRVLKSGWYILGKEVGEFEKELASYIGEKYAVGVASGTDALTIALKALGIKNGDGVIVPANVYPTAFGVVLSCVHIQLADVDAGTLNISIETLKKAVTRKTKAIIVVHLYGNPVDINPIKKFAKEKGILLIEDCAQAAGAEYKGKKVGTFGDIACFSFYPTKNLGAYGDGGAILTNNKRLAEKVRLWRMYGEKNRYDSVLVGHNSRLDEIQAAILRVKLKHLKKWNKERRKLAAVYKEGLKDLPVKIIKETMGGKNVYHLFVIKAKERDKLADYLKNKGIGTGVHYPIPIHLMPSFSYLGYKKGEFPVSERASREVLSLPIHPRLSKDDFGYVISVIREFFK